MLNMRPTRGSACRDPVHQPVRIAHKADDDSGELGIKQKNAGLKPASCLGRVNQSDQSNRASMSFCDA
jgi:hypothetical protein